MKNNSIISKTNSIYNEIDITKGILNRLFAVDLVKELLKVFSKTDIKRYEEFINICISLEAGPLSRAAGGILLEIALLDIFNSLCPSSVIRIDSDPKLSLINELSLFDILIDFGKWNTEELHNLAIKFLLATNMFSTYEEAEESLFFMKIYCPYFPIQVKKNCGSGHEKMTDTKLSKLNSTIITDYEKFYREFLCSYFNFYSDGIKISSKIPGLFFINYTPKNSNYSILEVFPMPHYENFSDKNFHKMYNIFGESDNNVYIIPSMKNTSDIGFLIQKNNLTRYYIQNRKKKAEMFSYRIFHDGSNKIKEEEFARAATENLMRKNNEIK